MINLHQSPSDINFSSGTDTFLYVNNVTNSVFGWFLLLCIYLVVAFGVSYSKKDISTGIAISGFFTLIIGTLMRITGLINSIVLAITFTVAILGFILFLFSKNRE